MAGLSSFLCKNVKPAKTRESFPLSSRFVEYDEDGNVVRDVNGQPVPALFTIEALEVSKYMRIASGSVSMQSGELGLKDDSITHSTLALIAESLKIPDLHDKALQDSYGVLTATDLIDKMFTSAEVQTLIERINKLQNGEGSFEDKVDEVKNF